MDAVEGILGHFEPAIPVYRIEFDQRNIWFDHDRYTRPFINDAVLWELFGHDMDQVKEQFLQPEANAQYSLKEAFNTQRKVEAWFQTQPSQPANPARPADPADPAILAKQKLRDGLYDLISNVLFFDVAGVEGQYYFRISMQNTTSFRSQFILFLITLH